jgi:hypothetical protein
MINYRKALSRETSDKNILDRRKKILVDNTCVCNDEFIPIDSWINRSD